MQDPQQQQPGYSQPYPAYPSSSQSQQQQQQQNVTIINQPAANSRAGQKQNIRDWSSGLCGCCEDCSSCCYAYWCYPCFLCTLSTKMDECYCGPHCCGSHGGIELLGNGCFVSASPNTFLVALRTKIRAQHGIRGSVCKDICCVWCCQFCSVTQIYRELKHVGND